MPVDNGKGKGTASEDDGADVEDEQPQEVLAWAQSAMIAVAAVAQQLGMEEQAARAADTVFAYVAQHLPTNVSEWPGWAAPLVDALDRALAQSRAEELLAQRRLKLPDKDLAMLKRLLAKEVYEGHAEQGLFQEDPAWPPSRVPAPLPVMLHSCDRCVSNEMASMCVVLPGFWECDPCARAKKACRKNGQRLDAFLDDIGLDNSPPPYPYPVTTGTSSPHAQAPQPEAVAGPSRVIAQNHEDECRGLVYDADRIRVQNLQQIGEWMSNGTALHYESLARLYTEKQALLAITAGRLQDAEENMEVDEDE